MLPAKIQVGEVMQLGDQLIRFDRVCTSDAYARIEKPGAEECGCAMCRNFIAQRSRAYPSSFLVLLGRLGIDASKEGEVYYLAPNKSGRRLYGGWFFFCGELLEAEEKQTSQDGVTYFVIGPGRMPSPNPREFFSPNPTGPRFQYRDSVDSF
jgi:hypothetical protein